MTTRTIFVAFDGREFTTEEECRRYEEGCAHAILNEFVLGFDDTGALVPWVEGTSVMAVKVIKIPADEEFENEAFDDAWNDVLEADLADEIIRFNRRTGWYVRNPLTDGWHYLKDYIEAYKQTEKLIADIMRAGF